MACVHDPGCLLLLWCHLLARPQPQPEPGRPCGQHISLSALPGLQLAHPSRVPNTAQPPLLSQGSSPLPFSIPASWCVSPVQGGWVAMAAMEGWCGGGPPWCRAPDLPRKGSSGPGPDKCFSRSPQKACLHPILAFCLHRVCFKSSHHTEKGMS